MLSVVIPTLDAADTLPRTLAALAVGATLIDEVVVSDGGSRDVTMDIAQRAGARVVTGPRGRGVQLQAGAAEARGAWVLFLHADTVLGAEWPQVVQRFCADPDNAERAGYFRFALDDESVAARRLAAAVAWRCRWLALPYGDQGLLIANRFYQALRGFAALPLMEDVDFARRLGRRRLFGLDVLATTSAARYRRDGYGRRSVHNLACLALYFAGVSPARIVRFYG